MQPYRIVYTTDKISLERNNLFIFNRLLENVNHDID